MPSFTPDTFVDGPAGGTPITAAKLNNVENEMVTVAMLVGDESLAAGSSAQVFKVKDETGAVRISFARLPSTATQMQIYGKASEPPILGLIGPNGTDYADFTFDGVNTEIDASTGNISLRPLAGGNVNIWAFSGTPKLRVGSTNFAQALDISHDGTNAHLNNTAAGYIGLQGDKFQVLTNGQVNYGGPTVTSATTGSNGAPPAQVAGYLTQQIGGVPVHIPYYF